MRENMGLYRGKTTPKPIGHEFNEVWVYGDLLRSGEKCYIHPLANAFRVDHELTKLVIVREVDPDTLGRETGLTDRNGKRIFEGDILNNEPDIVYSGSYTGQVVFGCGGFMGEGQFVDFKAEDFQLLEVIGNIHDNPELLDRSAVPGSAGTTDDTCPEGQRGRK